MISKHLYPIGIKMRHRYWLTLAVGISLVATGCPNAMALDVDAAATAPAPAGEQWDAQQLSAITPVQATPADSNGSVTSIPVYGGSIVTDQQGLAVSLQPSLQLTKDVRTRGPYTFEIFQLGASANQVLWRGQSAEPQVRVPAGVLQQGAVYTWQVVDGSDVPHGPYAMSVDTRRSGVAPGQTFGPVSVNLASGAVALAIGSRTVSSASGTLAAKLTYRSGQAATAGLPSGWNLNAVGQGWSHIQAQANGSVSMVNVSGMHTGYRPTGDGHSFQPVAPAGRPSATGASATLVKNADGSFTATMPSGLVSMFAATDAQGVGLLQQTFSGSRAQPRYELTNGKLTSVADSVADDYSIDLVYQGQGDCAGQSGGEGFVDPPDGQLCTIRYPDGTSTALRYIAMPDGSTQLGRIVDYPDTEDSKATVTDIGWDTAQRVVSVREGAAAAALASGLRTDPDAVVTSVQYDQFGRAALVKTPAAQAGQPTPATQIVYAPGQTTLTRLNAPRTTSGFLLRHAYDPTTLLSKTITDSKGETTTTTWNASQDQKLTESDQYGRTTKYTYDAEGGLASISGPGDGDSARETYLYDQDVSQGQPADLHGFHVTYWSNDSMTGTPAQQTFGPKFDDRVPPNVQWTWPSAPVPASDGRWGVRLTGFITIPGKGSASENFQFQLPAGNAGRLWIDNVACGTAEDKSCTVPLAPGQYPIRIDVPVVGEGGASITALWSGPGAEAGLSPIPITSIRPGYGLRSVVTKNDAVAQGQSYSPAQLIRHDDPSTLSPTGAWVQQFPEIKGSTEYAPFDPGGDQWGFVTSVTRPAGNSTSYSYYGPDEYADVPCSGYGHLNQRGRSKTIDRGDQKYQAVFDDMGRTIAMQTTSATGDVHAATCQSYNDAGQVVSETIPARGEIEEQQITHRYLIDGNPFTQQTEITIGDRHFTTSTENDLLGRPVRTTDIWGGTSQYTYDPQTGDTLSVTTTIGSATGVGHTSTLSNTYDPDGELTSVALDGRTLATLTASNAAGQSFQYFNGVGSHVAPSRSGGFGSQTWTTSDKQKLVYLQAQAPSQRILAEEFNYPDATAKFQYDYDGVGRLAAAELTTKLPVTATKWAYGFAPPSLGSNPKAGLNGNRTSLTTTGPNGTSTVQYGYNDQDQLTHTSDPVVGNSITYSDLGEMNGLGGLVVDYAANGETAKIADPQNGESISYLRIGGNTVEKTTSGPQGQTDTRYADGGYLLDSTNTPRWQVIDLPGGATLTRAVAAPGDLSTATVKHQTVRGQLMWTSDAIGKTLGDHNLYSPFGEPLLNQLEIAGAVGKQTAGQGTPAPDYQWQAGYHNETLTIGNLDVVDSGARLYVPVLGRFTSTDPIAGGSINAYDYANQDPINQADPTGKMPTWARILVEVAVPLAISIAVPIAAGGIGAFAGIAGDVADAATAASAARAAGAVEALSSLGSSAATDLITTNGHPDAEDIGISIAVTAVSVAVGASLAYNAAKAARESVLASRAAVAAQTQARVARNAARFSSDVEVVKFDPTGDDDPFETSDGKQAYSRRPMGKYKVKQYRKRSFALYGAASPARPSPEAQFLNRLGWAIRSGK